MKTLYRNLRVNQVTTYGFDYFHDSIVNKPELPHYVPVLAPTSNSNDPNSNHFCLFFSKNKKWFLLNPLNWTDDKMKKQFNLLFSENNLEIVSDIEKVECTQQVGVECGFFTCIFAYLVENERLCCVKFVEREILRKSIVNVLNESKDCSSLDDCIAASHRKNHSSNVSFYF